MLLLALFTAFPGPRLLAAKRVKYLGIEQGLSNNAVTCITQDRYGFTWMGTYDGLNRYDGYQFKIFQNEWGDNRSLVNNHIKTIAAVGNRIFAGTQRGLMYFDYADARFHNLYYHKGKKGPVTKVTGAINQIVSDGNGNIYIATEGAGLLWFKNIDTVGRQIAYQTARNVHSVIVDRLKRVWLFVNGKGLYHYDTTNGRLTLASTQPASSNCLVSDDNNHIWIGTDNGLYTYQPENGQTSRFNEQHNKLTSENIFSLTLTHDGNIWIATNGGGINIWDNHARTLSYLTPGDNTTSLRSGAISAVYEDSENRKWIATLRGGVNVMDNNTIPFHLYMHDAFNKNSVINNFILSFCEDGPNGIWIGTDGGGLSYWDTRKNVFTGYVHQPGTGSISSNFVVSMVKDYTGKLWVATFSGGIDAFDRATNRFKHYTCYSPSTKAEEHNFWKLYEDRQHRLWAGSTWGGALYLFNRAKDRFEVYDPQLTNIHTLYQDHTGTLWAGNYTQLIKIDVNSKKRRNYYIGEAIRSIAEDAKDRLWVGTEGGGLVCFNTNNNAIKRYTKADGLPSNAVLNILVDNDDNLWCSTYNGLSKLTQRTGKFTNYYESDGLQSNQFNYNAALKLSNGQMLFGGIKGFNMFYPDSINVNVHKPTLQLTDLKINNTSVEGNNAYSDNQTLYTLKNLTIPFSEATIAINYTALEYSFSDRISYAYYLENWDHNWNYVGKLKSAYYTRLNEGNYTLKIKSTDTQGNWTDTPLIIHITVLPPWYRTWWAYLIYIIIAGTLVYWFWRYRIRQTRLNYEVQIANLKVEREKEINEKKLSFFTNISHEFRTPLTLIINPIKDLFNNSEEHKEELNIIYRNARRLLGLVDHLLLFRKTETETTVLNITRVNFAELCSDVYTCFIHQAKIKRIKFTFDCPADIWMHIDREKVEIALFNLISNALKFTPADGSISIRVKDDADAVCFEIADSGIGIAEDTCDKLFDKFYQAKDSNLHQTGFGIGLYLVKTFIENHNGTVTYSSTLNGGSTFTLCIPKGVGQLTDTEQAAPARQSATYTEDHVEYDYETEEETETAPASGSLGLTISDQQSILIVDDNQEIRNYIKRIFAAEYIVYEAADGEAGLDAIRKYLPDVIISDIVMAGMSGLELCRVIKQDTTLSHIPIILLTGESTPDIRLQGIEEGAADFLSKPFDRDLLVARVKGIIRNKKELQTYFYNEVTLLNDHHHVSVEHRDFLNRCIEIIERSLTDPNLDVSTVAEKIGISHSNLYKKVKLMTGGSMNGFIRFIRLRKAAEYMINTNCTVSEAAFRVGFNDIKYFREHFNKQFGLNPSEFIKRHRTAFQKSYNVQKTDRYAAGALPVR